MLFQLPCGPTFFIDPSFLTRVVGFADQLIIFDRIFHFLPVRVSTGRC